jgi:small subunit ribosomal protein S16
VLIDSRRAAQSGGFLEILGSYNPKQKTTQLKSERIKYWISKGAKASDSVHNILVKKGVVPGPKVKILTKPKKKTAQQPADTESAKSQLNAEEKTDGNEEGKKEKEENIESKMDDK